MSGRRSPDASAPPRPRHRLLAAAAAAAIFSLGATLLWAPAILERWAMLFGERRAAEAGPGGGEGRSVIVRLAFLGPDGRTFEEERREVTLRRSVAAAARAILEELRGGSREGWGAVLDPAVRVHQVFVDRRGVAYVDLSGELLTPPAGAAPRGADGADPGDGGGEDPPGEAAMGADPWVPVIRAAQAVAATLGLNLPEVAQVQILVEGREVPVVADGVDLRGPLPASLPPAAPPALSATP